MLLKEGNKRPQENEEQKLACFTCCIAGTLHHFEPKDYAALRTVCLCSLLIFGENCDLDRIAGFSRQEMLSALEARLALWGMTV